MSVPSKNMIAFDTNLLVRLATNDVPKQAEIAEKLLQSNQVFISRTVLLETEWVLRSRYKVKPAKISEYFFALLNQDTITLENDQQVEQALEWYNLGADFADAYTYLFVVQYLCIRLIKSFAKLRVKKE